ncbi:hypothetical protein LRS10_23395 [Phenylobacterium sp. J426]|nr:hypothetical protein [Phenylobacterium sp. J426]MCR5876837.1 hypothetical protein [Phenylobacterium sp. J426]
MAGELLQVAFGGLVAADLQAGGACFEPHRATEVFLAADLDRLPAAVFGDGDKIPHHLGIVVAGRQLPAGVPEHRLVAFGVREEAELGRELRLLGIVPALDRVRDVAALDGEPLRLVLVGGPGRGLRGLSAGALGGRRRFGARRTFQDRGDAILRGITIVLFGALPRLRLGRRGGLGRGGAGVGSAPASVSSAMGGLLYGQRSMASVSSSRPELM